MIWGIVVFIGLALILTGGAFLAEAPITKYLEGPEFRAELDKQTSKGLHFKGKYEPLTRTGFLSAKSDGFKSSDGVKAFESIDVQGITGSFNPLGVFLRRWQLDSIHIDSGVARIQVYEPKPQEKPPKPWYSIFLPDRVYLKEVRCDKADIIWKMGGKDAGFYGSKVLITPHDRDFEYRLTEGVFKIPRLPDLSLEKAHTLITKEKLSLYELLLTAKGGGTIKLQGEAGLKSDKSMRAQLDISKVPIAPWIPASWGDQVKGRASGQIRMEGSDQNLKSSQGEGQINLSGARILSIPFLDYAASAVQNESLKNIELDECVIDFTWKGSTAKIQEIRIEAAGQFKLEGTLQLSKSKLAGKLTFGVSEKNLEWLPKAKEEIFTTKKGGYWWTDVNISGTLQEPQNDLTPRLAETLKRSPAESAGLFFRQIGEWFQQTLGKD